MQILLNSIISALKRLDPHQLYPQFRLVNFALYDATEVVMVNVQDFSWARIPKTDEFYGNTMISYHGHLLPIVDSKYAHTRRLPELVAMIVHEMFHVFQFSLPTNLMPNEILGITYPPTPSNFAHKLAENRALQEICVDMSYDPLRKVIDHQLSRAPDLGEFLAYEHTIETIEGTALYVEYTALSQLDPHFQEVHMCDHISRHLADSSCHLRDMHMHRGVAICLALDRFMPSWKQEYQFRDLSLMDLLKQKLDYHGKPIFIDESDLATARRITSQVQQNHQELLDQFSSEPNSVIHGSIAITKFDPMHVIKHNPFLFHQNGINYTLDGQPFSLPGPVLTRFTAGIFTCDEIRYPAHHSPKTGED